MLEESENKQMTNSIVQQAIEIDGNFMVEGGGGHNVPPLCILGLNFTQKTAKTYIFKKILYHYDFEYQE